MGEGRLRPRDRKTKRHRERETQILPVKASLMLTTEVPATGSFLMQLFKILQIAF